MGKKRSRRIDVNLKAECVAVDNNRIVLIKNVSKEGVCIQSAPSDSTIELPSGIPVELQIELPSGESLHLNCEIRWVDQDAADNTKSNVGLEIIDPPAKYRDFIKNLK